MAISITIITVYVHFYLLFLFSLSDRYLDDRLSAPQIPRMSDHCSGHQAYVAILGRSRIPGQNEEMTMSTIYQGLYH
jgi:hypothetical protein